MRSFTTLAAVAALSSRALAQEQISSNPSAKRGLVYVPSENPANAHDDDIWDSDGSTLTWYYNYQSTPTGDFNNTKLQFVPMLWGSHDAPGFHDRVKALVDGGMNISYVLAFNEPDGCGAGYGGSCLDAETAAQLWIQEVEPLKELGIKLGAPAVTGASTGFTWLENFFTQCNGNCSADFIPIHWYGNFEGLASHVGQVNATYENMTMWATEYALADGTLEESQEFFNQSATFFDRLEYLTHYSYFGSFRSDVSNVGPNAAMLTQKGDLTNIGAWYLGEPQLAVGNIPKGNAAQVAKFAGWLGLVTATILYVVS
ncbi:glycoside hydrolase family 128 protein [Polychaeton citri CBS 116435]|uniref:Glycoside hydrolase family 128 protein n=1 Tax=Polychaeton citri CBS 116435 TaxID=1314669 RepID=A0A9P4Q9R4_9PEZI|nr:glycoside hydrolase family 128 protein [Polychaeton citri CBS 116435]